MWTDQHSQQQQEGSKWSNITSLFTKNQSRAKAAEKKNKLQRLIANYKPGDVSYSLIFTCLVVFLLQKVFGLTSLYLIHWRPRSWQIVTCLFCHAGWEHLSGNMFNLIVFGKVVEEDMGPLGILLAFLTCGVVSNTISLWLLPRNSMGCGASGAIFGLFAVSMLGKLFLPKIESFSWRTVIDLLVFGAFVAKNLMSEVRAVSSGKVPQVDHVAHFGGVLAGAALILVLRKKNILLGPKGQAGDRKKFY